MADKCPQCGHYNMSYDSMVQRWICGCHEWQPTPFENCTCTLTIPESFSHYETRISTANTKGRHHIEPPQHWTCPDFDICEHEVSEESLKGCMSLVFERCAFYQSKHTIKKKPREWLK